MPIYHYNLLRRFLLDYPLIVVPRSQITSHITSARELRIGGKSNSCPKISSSLRSTNLVGDSVESRNSTEGNCIQSVDALTWLLRFSKLFVGESLAMIIVIIATCRDGRSHNHSLVLELFRQSCTQPDYTLRTCRTIAQLLAAL